MILEASAQTNQRPPRFADGTEEANLRCNNYGELVVQTAGDPEWVLLNEGSLFGASNTALAPGTGIAAASQATFLATSALLMVMNQAENPAGLQIKPDTLKLICTAVGTSITAVDIVAVLDDASRYGATPGGTGLVFTPQSHSNTESVNSNAKAVFGALTAGVATSKQRIVGRCKLKGVALIAGDEFVIEFGNQRAKSGAVFSGTASRYVTNLEPITIAPGKVLILHAWFTGATGAASFEPFLTTIER